MSQSDCCCRNYFAYEFDSQASGTGLPSRQSPHSNSGEVHTMRFFRLQVNVLHQMLKIIQQYTAYNINKMIVKYIRQLKKEQSAINGCVPVYDPSSA